MAINCAAKVKQSQRTNPKWDIQPSTCPVGSWSINLELQHSAAAAQMCEFWFCGRSTAWLSSPVVRIFTRPQGRARDHADHKTQLHKHCQRAWLRQRMGQDTEPKPGVGWDNNCLTMRISRFALTTMTGSQTVSHTEETTVSSGIWKCINACLQKSACCMDFDGPKWLRSWFFKAY